MANSSSSQDFDVNSKERLAPPGKHGQELVKYVLVELDVGRDNHQKFQERMPALVDLMFDHKRWELVFASYPITGKVSRFVHIWKIPDESDLVEVMRDGAVNLSKAQLPAPGTLEQIFRTCYLGVQELVESTKHRLMTALPYDPTHVGFQSQTILIDAEGEAFIIDHAALRQAAESKAEGLADIATELAQVRRTKFIRRNGANARSPEDAAAQESVGRLSPDRLVFLEQVQKHLNRGSAVARVTLGGQQALLFNLASLKAKSVYQAVEKSKPKTAPKLGLRARPVAEDGDVDMDVPRLLIAMPWGGVYDVNEAALETLVQAIPTQRADQTRDALRPILEGMVPIAAIPEERDAITGDGCACFVINLQSFSVAASGLAQKARKELDDKKKGS